MSLASGRSLRGRTRAGLIVGVVAVGLALVLWWVGIPSPDRPLDPGSHAPTGTSALVALLEELGAEVTTGVTANQVVPDSGDPERFDVVLVLRDRMDDGARSRLAGWARNGGTIVVADPRSALAPLSGRRGEDASRPDDPNDSDVSAPAVGGEEGRVTGPVSHLGAGECTIAPLDHPDIDSVAVAGHVTTFPVIPTAGSCFGDARSAFVVAMPRGEGTVVALGGAGLLTNETLGDAANAPAATGLLVPQPGTRIALLELTGRQDVGEETLFNLVPRWTVQALAQLALAFLVYVLWRSRRLGRPVAEPQPVRVASSELVAAVGGLLARSGSPQHAADLLRAQLRRELTVRLGLAADLPLEAFYRVVESRCRSGPERLRLALGPGPVNSDVELLAVARTIEVVREEVLQSVGTAG